MTGVVTTTTREIPILVAATPVTAPGGPVTCGRIYPMKFGDIKGGRITMAVVSGVMKQGQMASMLTVIQPQGILP